MAAATDDLVIDQGTTWAWAYQWLQATIPASATSDPTDTQPGTDPAPVDLTGWSATAQVRARYGAAEAFVTWSSDLDAVEAGEADGAIHLSADGQILLTLTAAVSVPWKWWRRGAVPWDLELTDPGGHVVRLVDGTATLRAEVTTRG